MIQAVTFVSAIIKIQLKLLGWEDKVKCELCGRQLGKKTISWWLVFYNLKSFTICEECNLSVDEQIVENLDYFWRLKQNE